MRTERGSERGKERDQRNYLWRIITNVRRNRDRGSGGQCHEAKDVTNDDPLCFYAMMHPRSSTDEHNIHIGKHTSTLIRSVLC
jgi:hypothetical protein